MEHTYYFGGTPKKIAWIIETQGNRVEQSRDHADIYLDKVTSQQSRYIALHVGIFWSIGKFIVKNSETVNVKIDSEEMYKELNGQKTITDSFIASRKKFIDQMISQRHLDLRFELINKSDNPINNILQH